MIPVPSAYENICGVSAVIISTKTRDFIDTSFWFRIHFDTCGLLMSAGAPGGKDSGGAPGFKPPHLCAFEAFWLRPSAEKLHFLPRKVSGISRSDVWQRRVASER